MGTTNWKKVTITIGLTLTSLVFANTREESGNVQNELSKIIASFEKEECDDERLKTQRSCTLYVEVSNPTVYEFYGNGYKKAVDYDKHLAYFKELFQAKGYTIVTDATESDYQAKYLAEYGEGYLALSEFKGRHIQFVESKVILSNRNLENNEIVKSEKRDKNLWTRSVERLSLEKAVEKIPNCEEFPVFASSKQ